MKRPFEEVMPVSGCRGQARPMLAYSKVFAVPLHFVFSVLKSGVCMWKTGQHTTSHASRLCAAWMVNGMIGKTGEGLPLSAS